MGAALGNQYGWCSAVFDGGTFTMRRWPTRATAIAVISSGTIRLAFQPDRILDIAPTANNPAVAPNWEIFDLHTLANNVAWQETWGKVFPADAGSFAGQKTIAGTGR